MSAFGEKADVLETNTTQMAAHDVLPVAFTEMIYTVLAVWRTAGDCADATN